MQGPGRDVYGYRDSIGREYYLHGVGVSVNYLELDEVACMG